MRNVKIMMITVAAGLVSAVASQAAPKCQLGILDLTANGGINPATNAAWAVGNKYRFAFVTRATTQATSADIATYNAFVNTVAYSSTLNLGGATWKVIGSTATVDARDNTSTNPSANGTGEAIFLVNGTTKIANNYADLWDSSLNHTLDLDEKGVLFATNPFTGSNGNGTKDTGNVLGNTSNLTYGVTTSTSANWMRIFNASPTSYLPVYALSDPLTIVDSADTTPPTLISFVDDKSGGPVEANTAVTYTVTFSEKMNAATVNTTDFENASATTIIVNSVTVTANPAVFLVVATPTIAGTLQLRVKTGSSLTDFTGNALNTTAAIPDNNILTVNDTTPPTLISLVDDKNGAAIFANQPVTYTVTFSEAMNPATVNAADFGNASATAMTVNSVTATANSAVFQVVATPTAAGTLRLQVKAGASLTDVAGNALITSSAIPDDTTITVNAPPNLKCQLGVLNLSNNNWINPATGNTWALGDKYRLAFVSRATTQATSTDITTYNTFVQGVANSSTLNLGSATWRVIGSTATVDARDNTSTNPLWNGTGEAVFLVDGTTNIANNYDNLWYGGINHALNLDERGVLFSTNIFTGSNADGTKDVGSVLGSSSNLTIGSTASTGPNWMRIYNAAPTSFLPVYALSDPLAVVSSVPLAKITSMTFPGYGAATISGTGITMTLPYGTALTSLAPTYILSAGAGCVPASGSSQNFTSPVHYVVNASDFATSGTTTDYTVTVTNRPIADPEFTLTAPATWDGRQTLTLQPVITNQALLQATGGTNLNYRWSVSGVAVIKTSTAGTLTLIRSQGNGPLTVTLTIDNGGFPSSHSVTVNVQQPATDAWVQRSPDPNEKPAYKQFYARDPNTNNGTLYYNGTGAGTTPVYLKVFAKPNGGTESQYGAIHRQTPVAGAYAFAVPIAAGLVTYRVEFGTTTGSTDTPTNTVADLVCGDAYLIEGQSNALATDNDVPADINTSPWIRSYGNTLGWGYATNKDSASELQLGVWGWIWAKHLSATYNMPVCIINGAVGGTRIDQHQPNSADHSQAGSLYSIYATLYNRIVGARLTHGIRAVLWHQGEQDQGSQGPFAGDFDYKFYQQLFVDMSAAWKQDFPNIQKYYIFQIWPFACGDTSRNDQLREVQRSLPYLYSNMHAMSTLGIVPGSSCHYVLEGYQKFSDLISPLVEQDFYGYMPGTAFSAPNLEKAYFSTAARNEITLEYDQNIAWNPGAPGLFYLDRLAGKVSSGSVTGKVIKLQLNAPSTARSITYLRGAAWDGVQGNLLYGSNGIAALTFADVPLTLVDGSLPPSAPSGLGATPGISQVVLTWTTAAGATGYNIKRSSTSGGSYTVIGTTTGAASYTDSTVTNGTTYYYVVSASNTAGESSDSNQASATPTSGTLYPPTLTSFVDDKSGGPVSVNQTVTYTVTFSKAMNAATVVSTDFGNAYASAITVNSVTPTANPAVFLVAVTPTAAGTLRIQVRAGVNLTDIDGLALVTTSAISDDTTITVNVPPTQLAFSSVPALPIAGQSFSVTVQAQDANGILRNVTSDTTVQLGKGSGSGALSGTTSGTITSGTGSVTITGVIYSAADTMTLTATASSGMSLAAATSTPIVFSINPVLTLTWDANGATTGQTDGTGTWLTANQWWNGSNNSTWTSGSNAVIGLGGAGGTITLGTVTAGQVLFNNFTGTYTLSGGGLTLNSNLTVAAGTTGNVTISTPISGTGGITQSGTGTFASGSTLTLSGTNTYTGDTTVNSGFLQVTSAGSFNNITRKVTVNSGGWGTVTVDGLTESINTSGFLTAYNVTSAFAGSTIHLNGGTVRFGRNGSTNPYVAGGNFVVQANSELDSYNSDFGQVSTVNQFGSLDFAADGYQLFLTDYGCSYNYNPSGVHSQFNNSTISHSGSIYLYAYAYGGINPGLEFSNTSIRAGKTVTVTTWHDSHFTGYGTDGKLLGTLGVATLGGAELLTNNSFNLFNFPTSVMTLTDTSAFDTTGGLWGKSGTTTITATLVPASSRGSIADGQSASFTSANAGYVSLTGLTLGTTYQLTLTLATPANQATALTQLAKNPAFSHLAAAGTNQVTLRFTATAGSSYFVWDNVHTSSADWYLGSNLTSVALTSSLLSAYDSWAQAHAGSGASNEDYNHDGIANGVAYFMGASGQATNPGVAGGKVTWPYLNTVTSFQVQVSDNLVDWLPANPSDVATAPPPNGQVIYTLPSGTVKKFCRLMVVP